MTIYKIVAILALTAEKQYKHLKGNKMLYSINEGTKTHKMFTALKQGEKLTASQVEKRFGIKNISAEASRIRQAGYAVYANSRKAGNGVQVTEYVMSQPSRRLIAAGYRALQRGL